DEAVAGCERGHGIGDAERQRVVPRRDDPHHAERVVVLVGGGEQGERALAALGAQEALGRVGVVAGDDGAVEHLLEGVAARLARLEPEQVEDLVLAVEAEAGVAQQDRPARGAAGARPGPLRPARAAERRLDVLGGARRGGAEAAAGERLLDLDLLARPDGDHALAQAVDVDHAAGSRRGPGTWRNAKAPVRPGWTNQHSPAMAP